MREKVKDKGRLEHILQACNDLLASKDKYTFDAVKDDPIIFYDSTLKSGLTLN